MITVFVHRHGQTEQVPSIDRGWLKAAAGVFLWVDLAAPSTPESLILSDTFAFHPLSVEDAMSARQYPKAEAYPEYFYVILHEIHFRAAEHEFATHDVDFFLGANYLVTVHDGDSRSIANLRQLAPRNPKTMAEGPVALFHHIVDAMVDQYRPEMEHLEEQIDVLEDAVFDNPTPALVRDILGLKRVLSGLRRVINPQRDVIARLSRREFLDISTEMSYRFRDVYDHLLRIADDALTFQDRITGVLDAHLSNVNIRMNEVIKVLTVVSTIFAPLMVLTGAFGMNLPLPRFPGSDAAQFWWLCGLSTIMVVVMLVFFRRRRWI